MKARDPILVYLDADATGGAELSTMALVDELDGDGAVVVILHHGLPAEVIGARRAVETPRPRVGVLGLLDAIRLARRIRGLRPAAFHASLTWQGSCRPGLVAARLARVPRRTAELHLAIPAAGRTGPGVAGWLGRPHEVVAVSAALEPLVRSWFRLPPEKVHVIGNTVAVDAVQAATPASRQELGVSDSAFLVLVAARLAPEKGIDVLVEALVDVEDVVLAVAGVGAEADRLAGAARSLHVADRIRWLGQRRDVPALLAAADAFALPSRHEGQPLALMEAMAAGLPIVATSIAGIDEIVVDQSTALLVPPDDAPALAAALVRLRDDRILRVSLGKAAEVAVRGRSSPAHATRVASVILGRGSTVVDPSSEPVQPLCDLDWRYLLPDSAPDRIAIVAGGGRERSTRRVGAVVVARDADLAVATPISGRSIALAKAVLAPNGIAYVSDERLRRRPLGRSLRALTDAGFGTTQAYWSWPPRRRGGPNVIVPYGDPAALRALRDRRAERHGAAAVLEWAGWLGLRLVLRTGRGVPLAIVAAAGEARLPRRTLLVSGRADVNKVVMLETSGDERRVLKAARGPLGEAGLRREAAVLASLPGGSPAPRLIGVEDDANGIVVTQTAVPGVPLVHVLTPDSFRADAAAVASALSRFCGTSGRAPWPSIRARAITQAASLGVTADLDRLLPVELVVPRTIEHGDCAPWNVLVSRGRQVVFVDWESGDADGLPYVDLIYFLTTSALMLDGSLSNEALEASYVRIWRGVGAVAETVADVEQEWRGRLGLSEHAARALRLVRWIGHADGERRRRATTGDPSPGTFERIVELEMAQLVR